MTAKNSFSPAKVEISLRGGVAHVSVSLSAALGPYTGWFLSKSTDILSVNPRRKIRAGDAELSIRIEEDGTNIVARRFIDPESVRYIAEKFVGDLSTALPKDIDKAPTEK